MVGRARLVRVVDDAGILADAHALAELLRA